MSKSDAHLWKAYAEAPTDANRNAIFDFHRAWIRRGLDVFLHQRHLAWDANAIFSLLSERVLTHLIPLFDTGRDTYFRAFLAADMPKAVIAIIRKLDRQSRTTYNLCRDVSETRERLSHVLCHNPTDYEVALALGIPESKVIEAERKLDGPPVVSVGGVECVAHRPSDYRANFEHLTHGLKERSKKILWLYYIEGYNMKETGEKMGLTESAISRRLAVLEKILRKKHAGTDISAYL